MSLYPTYSGMPKSLLGLHPTRNSWLIIAVFWMILTSACIASATDEDITGSRVIIRSGAEIDYPPFSVVSENGKVGGFSVELMRAALAAMGREAAFRTGPWDEVRGWLERGEIDALPLVGRTPEREALFDFTVPYMSLHGAIVVRSNETAIRDLSDLRGRQVAVMKGDNAEEFLRRKERDFEIQTTPTFEIALQELADGRHDAVVCQRLVALRLIQKTGLTDLRVLERPIKGFRQDFCFAVREGDRDTLSLLNEGLAIVVADGTYRHLHANWFAAMQLPTDRPLVVGGDRNFPPFEFLDEKGRPAGYNVDLTRAIAREMGLNVEIRLGQWPERMEALKTGKIDVLQGLFYSPSRDLNFDFTQAHTVSHYVAVVRKGEGPAPESIDALMDKHIVVEKADILHDFAIENGLEKQISLVDDQEIALRELVDGRHDCALVSRVTAFYLIEKHSWANLVLGKKPLLASEYCYAAAKGQKALLAQFGEGLKTLENIGEYRRIYDKWLSVYKEEGPSFLTALRYSALVIIPLMVILLVAFIWTLTLRRQVAAKTKALQESLDRFRYVFEAVNVGKSMTLLTGEVYANQAFADYLGYTLNELKDKRWQDLTPAEDIDPTEQIIAPLLAGERQAARFEKRYIHKSGELVWADVSVTMRRDADGKPLYFMTTVVDISKKKQAEEALRKSEEYHRLLAENTLDVIWTMNLQLEFTYVNSAITSLTGHSPSEWVGSRLPEHCNEKSFGIMAQVITDEMAKGLEGVGVIFETEMLKKNGESLPVEIHGKVIFDTAGQPVSLQGTTRDISERKRAQSRIEHLNRVLRAIRDVNQLIVHERNRDRLIREGVRLLVANRGYLSSMIVLTDDQDRPVTWAMEGLAASSEELNAMLANGELLGCCGHANAVQGVFLVDDRDRVCDGCPIAEKCAESDSICAPLIHEDETFGYLKASAENHLIVDEEERSLFSEMAGDFAYALSVMEVEAAHRESELRFRSIVENAPEPIFIQTQMRFAYLNPKALNLFGAKDVRDLLGTQVMERFHPDFHEQVKQRIKTLNEDRKPVEDLLEQKFLRMDGSPVWVETTGQPIIYDGENGALVFVRDISARKKAERDRKILEAQLNQAQKMESVGRLAGGVAHDYNNMLSVIIGFAEIALEKAPSDDSLKEDLEEILGAAKRSADITRQLLAFARKQTIAPEMMDLNQTMEQMLKMLRRLIGEDINLSWQPGQGRMPVFMDSSQFDQLLANLCVNARDAIDGVGKLTIETGRVSFDVDYCADHAGFVPGEFIMLAVSDDGCGMEKDELDKIFDPFFTTKSMGKGTGLGLSTVFGIVKQNDGFINVYSEPGIGTTFKIYLPRHTGDDAEMRTQEAIPITDGHGETVLIVEDEPPVLKLAQKILKSMGYAVIIASKPADAVALAEGHSGGIHLLITDVVMPEMNGRELSKKLQTLYPNLKTLFMSGYTANVIAHRGVLDDGVNFISKPFSKNDLTLKVRQALDNEKLKHMVDDPIRNF